jgi:redox-sensitive bicupin YhaK (pirin superfamily)
MTAILRPANQRGHANHGWLDTHHTFSFAHYFNPEHMGFRSLRVINDDVVQPGTGFATHGHRDMEIISYVVRGALSHTDSIGSKGIIRRGDIQVMSAGTGVRHSEYNASDHEEVRFLQIWIMPPEEGLPPSYDQRTIPESDKRNRLALLAGPKDSSPALPIHQDALVYASLLDEGCSIHHPIAAGRGAWVQVVDGSITVNGTTMDRGDGLAIEDVSQVDIRALSAAEFLLFDLA